MKSFKEKLNEIKMYCMAGFNGMIPLIIVGAIGMALSSVLPDIEILNQLTKFLNEVGLEKYDIVVSIIIANTITPKVGLISGFIIGYYSNSLELGIFGGIVSGLIAGYISKRILSFKFKGSSKALVSMIVVPIITAIFGFFITKYIIFTPLNWLQTNFIELLKNLSIKSEVLLAVILGLMTGFDLGGPVNKIAGLFGIITLTEGIRGPITYLVASYMLPSMAAGLAIILDKDKKLFDENLQTQGPSIFVLGLLALSEPSLPLMFSDMKYMVPINMFCSALLTGLFSIFSLKTNLALGVVGLFFMNKKLLSLIIFLLVLALHTTLILMRRKKLAKQPVQG